jgi:tetratricopeptide (TPR) repeat protein
VRRAVLALVFAALAGAGGSAQQLSVTAETAVAIERWVNAVMSHVPGQADASVRAVWALTIDDRRVLHTGMARLLEAVAGKRVDTASVPEERIAELARQLARDPGSAVFFKRAAVLHGDAAMAGYGPPEFRPLRAEPHLHMNRAQAMAAPLLVERFLYLESDGQVVGATVSDWNWIFGRSLLRRLKVPGADPFVGQWYHATMAFMFERRIFGEVQWHLEEAAELLPNDARILLDRGAEKEQQGLPRTQGTLTDADLATLRMGSAGIASRTRVPPSIGLDLGIQPVEVSNRSAEGFYKRALDRDPNLFEARVRLARLLTIRAEYADALEIITAAPPGTAPDRIAEYYAHLFAARAERGLGRLDQAAVRVTQARDLFPNAQSALFAASHIAMLRADDAGATEAMRHLASLPPDRKEKDDPWWMYETFTGRYATTLIAEMWKSTGFTR